MPRQSQSQFNRQVMPRTRGGMRQARRQRRGIAMMLVIISVMTATIMTAAYLSSRDNSAQIGGNVSTLSSTRWAAQSGLEMGLAIMETNTDWRTDHSNGVLFENYSVSGALVGVKAVDLETGEPPTEQSIYLGVTSQATSGDMIQTATAQVYVPSPTAQNTVDVDLSEFAVFAKHKLTMSDSATIGRWATAPRNNLRRRIAVGAGATGANTIELLDNSAIINGVIFVPPGSTAMTVNNVSVVDLEIVTLPDVIPVPNSPTPPAPAGVLDLLLDAVEEIVDEVRSVINGVIDNNSTLELKGPLTLMCDNNLQVTSNSVIKVSGDVRIIVQNSLAMVDSSIELEDGATLELIVGNALNMIDSYIGNVREDGELLDGSGYASYMSPERVNIYGSQGFLKKHWLRGDSVIKGTVYHPNGQFILDNNAVVYGNVVSKYITMKLNGAVFYDHLLDRDLGYTNFSSEIYDSDGNIRGDIANLTTFDDAPVALLADQIAMRVRVAVNEFVPDDLEGITFDDTVVAQSTPRPVPVDVFRSRIGLSYEQIESQPGCSESCEADAQGGL